MSQKENQPETNPAVVGSDLVIKDISDFLDKWLTISVTDWTARIDKWVVEFAYSGFDPRHIFLTILEMAKREGRTDFLNDIGILCTVFLRRGTNISTIIENTSEPGHSVLKNLQRVYSIVKPLPQAPGQRTRVGRDQVTLARIAAVFPFMTGASCIAQPSDLMTALLKRYSLPCWAGIPSLPSLFPRTDEFMQFAHYAMMCSFIYNYALAEYLHEQDPKLQEPNIATITNIVYSSFRTDYLPDTHRFVALWRLGILRKIPPNAEQYYTYEPHGGLILSNFNDHVAPLQAVYKRHNANFVELLIKKYGTQLPPAEGDLSEEYKAYLTYTQLPHTQILTRDDSKKSVYTAVKLLTSSERVAYSSTIFEKYNRSF